MFWIKRRAPCIDGPGSVDECHAGAVQWWLGDWVNYGEATYGETYSQALEATEYEEKTLRNYAYVARNIQMSRRRDNLTFSVHSEIVGLPTAKEQDRWLLIVIDRREDQ